MFSDFLKANSFAQSKCSEFKFFFAETCVKMTLQHVELQNLCQPWDKCMKLLPVFSPCFVVISPKFAQILKYIAQLCDCMIAAFINSGCFWFWQYVVNFVWNRIFQFEETFCQILNANKKKTNPLYSWCKKSIYP